MNLLRAAIVLIIAAAALGAPPALKTPPVCTGLTCAAAPCSAYVQWDVAQFAIVNGGRDGGSLTTLVTQLQHVCWPDSDARLTHLSTCGCALP